MDTYVFPAVITTSSDFTNIHISFPDLPDCQTDCRSLAEVFTKGKEILEKHLYDLKNGDQTIPFPTPPKDLLYNSTNQFTKLIMVSID